MTRCSSSFQRKTFCSTLRVLICLTLLRSCRTRNSFSDLDFSSQTLDPAATGFIITGNTAFDQLGLSASTAGDIDNDGYDDIIVAARIAVYVIYGGAESSFLNIDLSTTTLDPLTTGFKITGMGGSSGYSVSTAGDINNDGYDDIIIGSSGKETVYIIYGGTKSTMSNIALNSTPLNPPTTGFMITGNAAGDNFGISVSTAGDINNDGYDDVVVGAYYKNGMQGAAYVIYGGAKSTMSNIDLSSTTLNPVATGFMITGGAALDLFGFSVSTAGDINNDGYDDIIVGAYVKNSAYVIYGGEKVSMSNIFLSSTTLNPTSTGFKITGNSIGDSFGFSVSTAGDINKDGYDDIIVGAPYKSSNKGAVYVIYGGAKSSMSNIFLSSALAPTSTGFMIIGNSANDYLGSSVSTAGDINNDGYDDIIIAAPQKNSYQGAVYVIYGGAKSSMSNWDFSSGATLNPTSTGFLIKGNVTSDYTGYSVSNAGDINNDGYDDIIVGAKGKSNSRGGAYVIYAGCPKNCKQCSSESACTECKSPYLLSKSECLTSCPDATLATATTCEDCPAHCNICSSTYVCTQCKNSYLMYQSECFDTCPDGTFAITATKCEDCPAHCNHCISPSICTECFNPFSLYESQCLTSCPKGMFDSNNVCKNCPSYCSSCISQDGCQVCSQGYVLSNSRCILPSTSVSTSVSISDSSSHQAQEKAIQVIPSVTQGIGSVICVGSAIFPLSKLVSKIVQNTRYLNLSVTSELAEVYQTWQADLISWDVPNGMSDLDHFEASPPLFAQYDLSSPFLINFWPTLLNIGIGFGTFTACIILRKFCENRKYEGWAYSLVLKLVVGSFNFTLVQAYACLDDILFYLVLDAKTNPFNSFFSRASLICGITFLVLGCLLVFFNFWTVKKYQNIKNQGRKDLIETFNERNKSWELFYSDFNDDDLWSQSFFAIAMIRSVLSSFMISVLYDYPLMQTSYLVMLDIAIISFLFLKTPFKALRGTLAQYYYETITLLVHVCAFILGLQDSFDNPSDLVKLIISTGILYLNTVLVGGAIGFMFIEIYKTIGEKTRAAKIKQYENISIQTTTKDMSQDQSSHDETKRKLGTYAHYHQTASYENLPGIHRKSNFYLSGLNLESSQHQDLRSNFDADSSRELEMGQSQRINQHQDQSTLQISIRHKLRGLNPKQKKVL